MPSYLGLITDYKRNHIATAGYLRQWAGPNGQLAAITPPVIQSEPKRPENVGLRFYFWGSDSQLRREAEERISKFETVAVTALRRLPGGWPLAPDSEARLALARFIALHLWRSPAGTEKFTRVQRGVLSRGQSGHQATMSEEQLTQFFGLVSSDGFRVDTILGNLPKAMSVIGSMHWSLVEFPELLLATSDQPLTIVPILADGETAEVKALPDGPLLGCEEMRIALSPRLVLVLTWLNLPDDQPVLQGSDGLAADLNRAVIGQADRQWFHHPARRPTTLVASVFSSKLCPAVGRSLLADYSWQAALTSKRRLRTAAAVNDMIEHDILDEIRIERVERKPASIR